LIQKNISEIKSISQGQFSVLVQISKLLNSASHKENLIEKSLDLVVEVIRADRGVFVRHDTDTKAFEIIAARKINQESISDLGKFSSGILQQVITKRESCLYHDVMSDPNISQFESVQRQQIKSILGVPVFYKNKIWGVILADSQTNRREFTNENLLFLQFFSNLISLSLDNILHLEELADENEVLRNQLQTTQPIPNMIGSSKAMSSVSRLIHKVAPSDATVLILGESGTGKDLAAKAIHRLSLRSKQPYLAQFCGSIPDSLLESELFGYKRGAFTGANSDKKGLFEVSSGGTFFLDEIADISMALQAKLLRVIENQEIIPLGDTRVRRVDVRLIAATNKDLRQLSKEGKFREDLFYRLNVFPVFIPPLRERREDIPALAEHFVSKYAKREVKIEKNALVALEKYDWPGNVRQLENIIQRALILIEEDKIQLDHIILEEQDETVECREGTLKEIETLILRNRLKNFNGNRTLTAQSLGVSVRWVQIKIKELGI
jgi:Nif-specific regulatory protein